MCIRSREIIDRHLNKTWSISLNRKKTLTKSKTNKRLLLSVHCPPRYHWGPFDYCPPTNVHRLMSHPNGAVPLFILSRGPQIPSTGNRCSRGCISLYSYKTPLKFSGTSLRKKRLWIHSTQNFSMWRILLFVEGFGKCAFQILKNSFSKLTALLLQLHVLKS